jgi:hypothetical protein
MGLLPDGTHLAYVVRTEAKWWRQPEGTESPVERQPGIDIMASLKGNGNGGGVAWEFAVTDRRIPGAEGALFVEVYSDSWRVFTDIPEFFRALSTMDTLDEIREWLDKHYAEDETSR